MHKFEKLGDTSDSLWIEESVMVTDFGVSWGCSRFNDTTHPLSSFSDGKPMFR
jgi:hypothetical protein